MCPDVWGHLGVSPWGVTLGSSLSRDCSVSMGARITGAPLCCPSEQGTGDTESREQGTQGHVPEVEQGGSVGSAEGHLESIQPCPQAVPPVSSPR